MSNSKLLNCSLILPVLLLILSSCHRIEGSGNIKKEKRNLKGFSGIESYGSINVVFKQGSDFSVEVEADDNLLQYIKTDVDGDHLEIGTADRVSLDPSDEIEVRVTAPSYSHLSVSGSGDLTGENRVSTEGKMTIDVTGSGNLKTEISAGSVEAEIAGSGEIVVKGTAKSLNTHIIGSGNFEGDDLVVQDAEVKITGSGNAEVNASGALKAGITGSGNIGYHGSPRLESNIAGSGSVHQVH